MGLILDSNVLITAERQGQNARQMLAANSAAAIVSPSWFADYSAGQSAHVATPTISATSTSVAANTRTASSAGTTWDWIVQFDVALASNIASPAAVAGLALVGIAVALGWKPGENRTGAPRPAGRSFSKPGAAPRKEGGGGYKGSNPRADGARRSYGDR